mgnify:FL=1
MELFPKVLKLLLCIIILVIMLSGCTDKKNLTGDNFSDIRAITIEDKPGIIMGFSFPAETKEEITGKEAKLLAGNYQKAVAKCFLRFTELPSMITETDSCFLTINISKRSALPRNPLILKLCKLNSVWLDSLNLNDISEDDLSLLAEYTVADTVGSSGKVITFNLSSSEVVNWSNPDSTGWNFVLKAENEGWVEITSLEGTNKPTLNFKYKTETGGEWINYNKSPAKDTYILEAPETNPSELWKISNLNSSRLYIKYEPTYTLFQDNEGNTLTDIQLKRLTVNKAEIVLHIKNNDYYNSSTSYSLYPFNVVKDSINSPLPLLKSDYETLVYTSTSSGIIKGDSLTVDVAPIIQAYTSGEKIPKGIMIKSFQERKNFGTLEFWDCNESTPAEKKPYIKITYTPPYL